jgi:hypothetical protein
MRFASRLAISGSIGPVIDRKIGAIAIGFKIGNKVIGTTSNALKKTIIAILIKTPEKIECPIMQQNI